MPFARLPAGKRWRFHAAPRGVFPPDTCPFWLFALVAIDEFNKSFPDHNSSSRAILWHTHSNAL